jgi:preprotein translocase subunit SecG
VTEAGMLDALMVVLTIVFFVIAVAYVVACERLH